MHLGFRHALLRHVSPRVGMIFRIRCQALLCVGLRWRERQVDQYRKVIRATGSEPLEADQGKLATDKKVINRPAHERAACAERIEQTPAHARIEQAADFAKQPCGGRPRNIIEVTTIA